MPDLHTLTQYLLPKQALTCLAGTGARHEGGALTQWVIRRFIRHYQVNMQEAEQSDPAAYPSFNAFFTRALRADARPLADSALVCPVDGAVSQLGRIQTGRIFQAKGHDYSANALLAGDEALAARFADGQFATIYLSPRDYHRVHMPCAGQLRQMIYVPGELFSVSPATAAAIPGLFARNERVVCVFDAPWGPWVLVLVGAAIVGSMATVWHGTVNPPRPGRIQRWTYPATDGADLAGAASPSAGSSGVGVTPGIDAAAVSPSGGSSGMDLSRAAVAGREAAPVGSGGRTAQAPVFLDRGAEMGRFMLGSTVVMLFPAGAPELTADWQPGQSVRMGERMSQA